MHNKEHIAISNFIFKYLSAKKLQRLQKETTFNEIREI